MKYRNNLIHFIRKEFETEENNLKKQKDKLNKKYNAYKVDLKKLKTICENKGIDTLPKLEFFIEQMEQETYPRESNNPKIIGSAVFSSLFTGIWFPVISEKLKTDTESFLLFLFLLPIAYVYAYSFTLIVSEAKYYFSKKEQNKKMLKMLYDIKVLYYTGETTDEI